MWAISRHSCDASGGVWSGRAAAIGRAPLESPGAGATIAALIHALGYDLPADVSSLAMPRLNNWAGEAVGRITAGAPLMAG